MLAVNCIGHIGSDAEFKQSNGREFTTFRVAHSDRWTDDAGNVYESTTWVDCIMSGRPGVFEYLKKGQLVFVSGSCSLRVYSSQKERCMKAGMQINVRQIELLGGKSDEIPSALYNANSGVKVDVEKWYRVPSLVRDESQPEWIPLVSRTQARFVADRDGWVSPFVGDE